MNIDRLHHLVLTVRDVEVTCAFYTRVMQMQAGPITSVYFRDPDGNLIEVAEYHRDDDESSPRLHRAVISR